MNNQPKISIEAEQIIKDFINRIDTIDFSKCPIRAQEGSTREPSKCELYQQVYVYIDALFYFKKAIDPFLSETLKTRLGG